MSPTSGIDPNWNETDKLHYLATEIAKKHDRRLSMTAVRHALEEGGVRILKPVADFSKPSAAQHHAAWEVKSFGTYASMFSAFVVLISCDQKANVHGNQSAQTKRRNGGCWQSLTKRRRIFDHDANEASTIASFGLYAILFIALSYIGLESSVGGAEGVTALVAVARKVVGGWFHLGSFMASTGRQQHTYMFGHCQSIEGETACRNVRDIAELMDRRPHLFASDAEKCAEHGVEPGIVPHLFIVLDGGHGPRHVDMQFCAGLIFLLFDLDSEVLNTNAGGQSKLNPAEGVVGAAGTRTNGWVSDLGISNISGTPASVLEARLSAMLGDLCATVHGARCKGLRGGEPSSIICEPAIGMAVRGFEFDVKEIATFLKLRETDKKTFSSVHKVGDVNQAGLYRAVWTMMMQGTLPTSGRKRGGYDTANMRATQNTLVFRKRAGDDIPQLKPMRGGRATDALFALWAQCGERGFPPQPAPPFEARISQRGDSWSYAALAERIAMGVIVDGDGSPVAPDAWHPQMILSWWWDHGLREAFTGGTLDATTMTLVQKKVHCDKATLEWEMRELAAKECASESANKLEGEQKRLGIDSAVVRYAQEHNFASGKTVKDPVVMADLKAMLKEKAAAKSIDLKGRRPVLVQRCWDRLVKDHVTVQLQQTVAAKAAQLMVLFAAAESAEQAALFVEQRRDRAVNSTPMPSETPLDVEDEDDGSEDIDRELIDVPSRATREVLRGISEEDAVEGDDDIDGDAEKNDIGDEPAAVAGFGLGGDDNDGAITSETEDRLPAASFGKGERRGTRVRRTGCRIGGFDYAEPSRDDGHSRVDGKCRLIHHAATTTPLR